LVGRQQIVALMEPVDLHEGEVRAQQIGQRAVLEPMAVQAPFAARIDEPVKDEGLDDPVPAGTLAARRKLFAPEGFQPELLPELAAKPAGSPLAGPLQTQVGAVDADGGNLRALFTGQMLRRKERDLLGGAAITGKQLHGPAPGSFLDPIEFTQIEHVALQNASIHDAAILDDTPVMVYLAILPTFLAWPHCPMVRRSKGAGRHYKHF
jgi:hypothetical protein